ncbi:amino acid transmembrane transporter [Rhodotorula toruloides]|uniref:Amino acid transmembrane transporter n=1 Tax=Rhodotorula toruloides TaxID=5286 RepID=A0A511KCT6_RHOTO|nr:amino acid transmembrane transporter [Rhodotorula toruloides]
MATLPDLEKAQSPALSTKDDVKKALPTDQQDKPVRVTRGGDAVAPEHLKRSLSARQVSMIAIGGTIGTGLFLGTGRALHTGGPGDLTAAQVLMAYWTDRLTWLPSLFFLFFLVGINLMPVHFYGELEYWLSILKVLSVHEYIGGQYWTHGAAPFVDGFGGFAKLFVSAAFAYGGTESRDENPIRNIPRVTRGVFWRILIFYISTVIIIGFNVPYDYPNLSTKSTATSPFTLVFQQAGSKAGGSFMNAVILTSVLSAGNHAMFAGARVLYGLAVIRQAPSIFRHTNAQGVPWVSVLAISSVSLLFFGYRWACAQVSNQLAWLCIGIASFRFRLSWKKQGRTADQLRYPNPLGIYGGLVIIVATTFIILVQGWTVFRGPFNVAGFVANYIELPIFAGLYLFWRFLKGVGTPSLSQIDLDSGRVDRETRRQVEQLRAEMSDRWRAEAWKVKASWMAGLVPSHESEGAERHDERDDGKEAVSTEEKQAEDADDPPLQPTIISDADGAAEMSRRVDDKVESGMLEQMKVAEEVVRGSVERSEGMEMELWLGQAILDGFSAGAGDGDLAARFVLDRLEDAFYEAGLSADNVK